MSVSRTKRTATGTRSARRKIAAPRQVEDELAQLSQRGWRLSESHRKLYHTIREDPSATAAFENLTTGSPAISRVILLLSLEALFFSRGTPHRNWQDWELWKEKWDGLGSTAKSLKLVAAKIEKLIQRSDRGPIPLPTILSLDGEPAEQDQADYSRSHLANRRLSSIAADLRDGASEIESLCQMRSKWVQRLPGKYRQIVQRERLAMFLRFVKARMGGEPHFEDLACLLSACTRVSHPEARNSVFSGDYLRKLMKSVSTPLLEKNWPR